MADKTQNLSIRLLKADLKPEDSVRQGVQLDDWPRFEGAKISTGSVGGNPPSWTDFLSLTADKKGKLFQRFAFGLVFLFVEDRWFAISFGLGHSKIDPSAIEQDFGLKVVLNTVDHTKLRSADLRTPDANTVSRRSQTSADQNRPPSTSIQNVTSFVAFWASPKTNRSQPKSVAVMRYRCAAKSASTNCRTSAHAH